MKLLFPIGGHQEVVVHNEARAHERQRTDGEFPDIAVHSPNESRHLHAIETAEKIHVW
jgi:hypothetical protein